MQEKREARILQEEESRERLRQKERREAYKREQLLAKIEEENAIAQSHKSKRDKMLKDRREMQLKSMLEKRKVQVRPCVRQ